MIQSSALRLRLNQFKISSDNPAFNLGINASGIANECTPGLAMPVCQATRLGPDPKIEPFMDRLRTRKMCVTAKHFRQSFL